MSNSLEGVLEGDTNAEGLKIAVIVSRFNDFICNKLLKSAVETFSSKGGLEKDLQVVRVPGAFEIPLAASKLAETKKYDAIVCLGAVIRGDTPHFDYVCSETARGISKASDDYGMPVAFGIITSDTLAQAIERSTDSSGDKAGEDSKNKGREATLAAIEMANLLKKIK